MLFCPNGRVPTEILNMNSIFEKTDTGYYQRGLGIAYFQMAVLIAVILYNAFFRIFGLVPSSVIVLWLPVGLLLAHSVFVEILHRGPLLIKKDIHRLIVIFYLLSFWKMLQVFWSVNQGYTINEAFKSLILLVFVYMIYVVLSKISTDDIFKITAITITVVSFAIMVIYLEQLFSFGGISDFGSRRVRRLFSIFAHINTTGTVLLLLGLWNWILFFGPRTYRRIGMINFCIIFFVIYGIASNSALVGYVASILVFIVYYAYRNRSRLSVSALILGPGMLVVAILINVLVKTDLHYLMSAHERIPLWLETFDVLKKGIWVFGIGAGASLDEVIRYDTGFNITGRVHNAILTALLEGGVVELILQMAIYFTVLRMALQSKSGTSIAVVAMLVAVFTRNLVESSGLLVGVVNNFWLFLSWYVLMIYLVIINRESSEKTYLDG